MARRLKSALESPKGLQSLLVLKSFFFSFLLYLTSQSWFYFFPFLIASFYLYSKDSWNVGRFRASFLILLIISLVSILKIPSDNTLALVLTAGFFGFLFFLLFGVKNMIFIGRTPPYYFLNSLLLSSIFVLFFNADKTDLFVLKYLSVGIGFFLLFREFLTFNIEIPLGPIGVPALAKKDLIAAVFAFIILELLWVVALLPIGFLNSVSFLLLSVLLLEDLLLHSFYGTMTRQIILRNATFFIAITLVIFGFSRWSP